MHFGLPGGGGGGGGGWGKEARRQRGEGGKKEGGGGGGGPRGELRRDSHFQELTRQESVFDSPQSQCGSGSIPLAVTAHSLGRVSYRFPSN